MLGVVLLFLSLAGYGLAAHVYLKLPSFQAPLFAMCSAILALYIGGFFNLLDPVCWTVFGGGLLALVGVGVQLALRHFNQHTTTDATDAPDISTSASAALRFTVRNLTVIIALLVLASLAVRWAPTYKVLNWDEFSHWAYATKVAYITDGLPKSDSPLIFTIYPPGATLNQYLFVNIAGYQEWIGLFGQVSLIWASILAAAGPVAKRPLTGPLVFAFSLVAMAAFRYSLLDVYVDSLLAVLLAGAIVPLATGRRNWAMTAYLAVVLGALTLVKPMGAPLAIVAAGCFGLLAVIDALNMKASEGLSRTRLLGSATAKFSVVIAAIVAVYFSWEFYQHLIGAKSPYSPMGSVSDLLQFFTHPTDERSLKTWDLFPKRLTSDGFMTLEYPWPGMFKFTLDPSILTVVGSLIVVSALVVIAAPHGTRLRSCAVVTLVGLGIVPYVGALMAVYRFTYTEHEGQILAGLERYVGTYALMWLMVVAGMLANHLSQRQTVYRAAFAAFVAIFICGAPTVLVHTLVLPENRRAVAWINENTQTYAQQVALRERIDLLASIAKGAAKPGDKVYYISQHETGYSFVMFRFAVAPIPTNLGRFAVGKPYFPGDIWTEDVQLDLLIAGYQFLVIGNADQQFWNNNAKFFAPDQEKVRSGVFRITTSDSGMRMIPVPH